MVKVKSYLIQSRYVMAYNKNGKRLRPIRWGNWQDWDDYKSPFDNFTNAVSWTTKAMQRNHKGYVIYRRVVINGKPTADIVPLYQAKYGYDKIPFTLYSQLGEAWKKMILS
jgi:hypothetical protein